MDIELKVSLPWGWSDRSAENPDEPPTFVRDLSRVSGILQISPGLHAGGDQPGPSEGELKKLAEEFGSKSGFGEPLSSGSGRCKFGRFGTAVFRAAGLARIQLWHLCNGKDFIFVTHKCSEEPDPAEVYEAQEIVQGLTLQRKKPWWKFWQR